MERRDTVNTSRSLLSRVSGNVAPPQQRLRAAVLPPFTEVHDSLFIMMESTHRCGRYRGKP